MYSMDIVTIAQNDSPTSDTQPNKGRRKKSMVWEHFTIETIDADCVKACCNQCKKSFAYISGSKLAGTSHLKRHITMGICPVSRQNQYKEQPSPSTPPSATNISVNVTNRPRKRFRAPNAVAGIYLPGDNGSDGFAKMIIQHDYPLQMAEHSGFIDLAKKFSPQFSMNSAGAVEEQIMNICIKEKHKLVNLVSRIPGRLGLTIDVWTSNQSRSYVLLTGQFTDSDWKLQRRVFSFIEVPCPDSDTAYSNAVAACLADWNSEGKLFTFTINHANENARGNIRSLLSIKNSRLLNGQLLINSCYARVLCSLVQDALCSMRKTIDKVRHSVKYVKTSAINEERFIKLKEKLQVPSTKNLVIDDLTKWNTTYHVLVAASELKEVFSCLDTSDPDYKLTPSMEEWEQVKKLCTYLKIFYEAANILTSPVYPTSNIVFHDVWTIQYELILASNSSDFFVRNLTKSLNEKFTKYWEDCNLVLAVAVVMDPRFKMKLVEFSFSRIYTEGAETWIKNVDEGLHELYDEYMVESLPAPTFLEETYDSVVKTDVPRLEEVNSLLTNGETGFPDFDIYISDIMEVQHMRSELDQYLEEPLLPRSQDFDVLGWWKLKASQYPTLSRMASDVLSIPLSTLSQDSVFDTRERKLDSYRSSLKSSTLEALVCSKDWLKYVSPGLLPVIAAEIPSAIVETES